jgi:hypothetical protein
MTAIKVRFGDQYLITPSAMFCEWIVNRWRSGAELSRGQRSVIDLMLAGFCLLLLLLLTGCATAPDLSDLRSSLASASEEIVSINRETRDKSDAVIEGLRENTAALNQLKSKIETIQLGKERDPESESVPPAEPSPEAASDKHPSPLVASSETVRLFVTSAKQAPTPFHCPPCERMQKDMNTGKFAEFEINWADPFEGQKSYPATRFRNADSPTGWSVIYGYDSTTLDAIRKATGLAETTAAATPVAMSHSELVALHNSLHGGGQHSWPGDLATHLQSVHGVVTTGGAPVTGAIFPSYRTNQVTSQRSVVRSFPQRTGFFGWSRNTVRKSCPTCPR